jgi:hypothetical protein
MSKRITITVDESIYEMLEASARESMRPIAVEAVYRIKLGLGEGRPILTQESEGEVIEKVNKRLGRVPEDKESMKSLEKLVKDGVVKKGVKQKEWIGPQFKDSKLNKKINNGHNN